MKLTNAQKEAQINIILRRLRESAGLTMRQAGGLIGISHCAISQFENGKLRLPSFRIEQMAEAYGYSKEDFDKIMGRDIPIDALRDCIQMLEKLNPSQLLLIRNLILQIKTE